MTTYNTYQAARIANPECEIYIRTGEFWPEKSIAPSPRTYESRGFKLCNPADYCMTVEKFLADGCKFNDGGAYLDWKGKVRVVGSTGFTKDACNDIRNIANADQAFILRAAALEDKTEGDFWAGLESSINEEKPRTKIEYVPCEYIDAWEPVKAYCDGDEFFNMYGNKVACPEIALNLWVHGRLYRRIETPMTEREAFVEAASKALPSFDKKTAPIWAGKLYDSGMFKLVK